eukprot:TRINITY_DN13618_c0_g2_i1.p1 TRINITY_DN13618_c0_g2~~TRINITY_DN13618_c0_g2_i1.p1  ORF type:complete len:472 (+),score=101.68 TRINITY_DN13618_c0_g2_i1:69-1484(+)
MEALASRPCFSTISIRRLILLTFACVTAATGNVPDDSSHEAGIGSCAFAEAKDVCSPKSEDGSMEDGLEEDMNVRLLQLQHSGGRKAAGGVAKASQEASKADPPDAAAGAQAAASAEATASLRELIEHVRTVRHKLVDRLNAKLSSGSPNAQARDLLPVHDHVDAAASEMTAGSRSVVEAVMRPHSLAALPTSLLGRGMATLLLIAALGSMAAARAYLKMRSMPPSPKLAEPAEADTSGAFGSEDGVAEPWPTASLPRLPTVCPPEFRERLASGDWRFSISLAQIASAAWSTDVTVEEASARQEAGSVEDDARKTDLPRLRCSLQWAKDINDEGEALVVRTVVISLLTEEGAARPLVTVNAELEVRLPGSDAAVGHLRRVGNGKHLLRNADGTDVALFSSDAWASKMEMALLPCGLRVVSAERASCVEGDRLRLSATRHGSSTEDGNNNNGVDLVFALACITATLVFPAVR